MGHDRRVDEEDRTGAKGKVGSENVVEKGSNLVYDTLVNVSVSVKEGGKT